MGPKRHATSSRDVTTPSRCDGTERCGRGRQQPRGVGDGTTTNRLRPVRVEGLIHVIQIGAGAYHSSPLDRTQRCGRGAGTDGASSGSGRSRLFESGPGERSREPRIDRRRTPAQHRRRPQRRGVQLGIDEFGRLGNGMTSDTGRTRPARVSGVGGVSAVGAGHSYSVVAT
jgi:hypothetical protein